MSKQNVLYGIGGLVIGLLLVNLLMPVTWRGSMMAGQGLLQTGGAQCGPAGCTAGSNYSGMMGSGGAGMMNASDIDKAFIEEMIPHHRMAVMMATMLKTRTTRPEMQKLADDIISAQTKEIEMMQGWYDSWY